MRFNVKKGVGGGKEVPSVVVEESQAVLARVVDVRIHPHLDKVGREGGREGRKVELRRPIDLCA